MYFPAFMASTLPGASRLGTYVVSDMTTAAPNNGAGGVFLRLTSKSKPLILQGFAVPTDDTSGGNLSVQVWTRPGSYFDFEGSSNGWTLTQTLVGRAGSSNTDLVPFNLTSPIHIPAHSVVSLYLHSTTSGAGIRFTGVSGTFPQESWDTPNLHLLSDYARTGPVAFAGAGNLPRAFSGSLWYEIVDPTVFANGFE